MNVITRGMRGALRSPLRSGAILLMLAVSIGLILAMLVAKTSVEAKIAEIKSSTATEVTINPAGFSGGMGGGDAFTADQVKAITSTAHIQSVTSRLTDQLGSEDTNLTPSLDLGNLGKRHLRIEDSPSESKPLHLQGGESEAPKPKTEVTGTTDPVTAIHNTKLTSGDMINGTSSDLVALVGKNLAEKNNLTVGSTFTAYGKTLTVKGIFSTDNKFFDSGVVVPLATLQTLTIQTGAVSSITAKVDSSDNVTSTVSALKTALGDKADITSQLEQAENSLKPLEGIASLALAGVLGATAAGAAIILLSMIMIVRERRREIGVIKAIGGKNSKVVGQFIAEALTLTIIGGVIGIGMGIVASGPMTQSLVASSESQNQPPTGGGRMLMISGGPSAVASQLETGAKNVTASLTPQVFWSSVGITLLIAIIGSAVPAWAVARVRPAEVLRTE